MNYLGLMVMFMKKRCKITKKNGFI